MKIQVLQPNIEWESTFSNLERFETMLCGGLGGEHSEEHAPVADVDLIVLPEMFATGFGADFGSGQAHEPCQSVILSPQGEGSHSRARQRSFALRAQDDALPGSGTLAADHSSQILAWMQRMAARLDAAIVGSVAVSECVIPSERSESIVGSVAVSECVIPSERSESRDLEENLQDSLASRSLDSLRSLGMTFSTLHTPLPTLKNRLFFVRPDGSFEYYDKRHLFTYSGENRAYTAGNKRVITEWRGVRFLLQVCYDLRFPVFSRNRGGAARASDAGTPTPPREPWDGDYDVAIYAASWPLARVDVWDLLLRARAIENVCYVVGCNRVGTDPTAHYNGHSAVLDYLGQRIDDGGAQCAQGIQGARGGAQKAVGAADAAPTIAEKSAPVEIESLLTAEISTANLARFRRKFPVLADADDFIISTPQY